MRRKSPLAKTYGKWLVLQEVDDASPRAARVRCTCGVEREVPVYNLAAGLSRSCGAAGCRVTGRDPAPIPHRPMYLKALTPAKLRAFDVRMQRGDTGPKLRDRFKVSLCTAYTLMKKLRHYGGADGLLAEIEKNRAPE